MPIPKLTSPTMWFLERRKALAVIHETIDYLPRSYLPIRIILEYSSNPDTRDSIRAYEHALRQLRQWGVEDFERYCGRERWDRARTR